MKERVVMGTWMGSGDSLAWLGILGVHIDGAYSIGIGIGVFAFELMHFVQTDFASVLTAGSFSCRSCDCYGAILDSVLRNGFEN